MIRQYHLTANNRPHLIQRIEQLDPTRTWSVTAVEWKARRSNEQNKWMRGFAKDFGKNFGYHEDEAYELIMYKFCPHFMTDPETGKEIRTAGHFSKLQDGTPRNTKDAAEIQDAVQRWAAELGFIWEGM